MEESNMGEDKRNRGGGSLTTRKDEKFELDIQRKRYDLPEVDEPPNYKRPIYWIIILLVVVFLALLPVILTLHKKAAESDDYIGTLVVGSSELVAPVAPDPVINIDAELAALTMRVGEGVTSYILNDLYSWGINLRDWQIERLRGDIATAVVEHLGAPTIHNDIERAFLQYFQPQEYRLAMKDSLADSDDVRQRLAYVKAALETQIKAYHAQIDQRLVLASAIFSIGEERMIAYYIHRWQEPAFRSGVVDSVVAELTAKYSLTGAQQEELRAGVAKFVGKALTTGDLTGRLSKAVTDNVEPTRRWLYVSGRLEDHPEQSAAADAAIAKVKADFIAEHDESFNAIAQNTTIELN